MFTLAEALAFVNGQSSFHEGKIREFGTGSPRRTAQHEKLCTQFSELATFLQRQDEAVKTLQEEVTRRPATASPGPFQLALRFEDIKGLPEELIKELSITDGDMMDFTIQSVMQERGGIMTIDQLLIALFHKTGEILKRTNLNARIYRMTTKGAFFNVPGRKGVYSVRELTDAEAGALERGAIAPGGNEGPPALQKP